MEELLNKLYNYEYFGIYLMIAIIVLILLFIVILFFGKKDKKKREIEETEKLLKVNAENTFKEENTIGKVEGNIENNQNDQPLEAPLITNVTPQVNEQPSSEEIIPPIDINTIKERETEEIIEPITPASEEINNITTNTNNNESNEPILDKVEEKPIIFSSDNEVKIENNVDVTWPNVNVSLENLENNINLTDVNEKIDVDIDAILNDINSEINKPKSNQEVFSSVFTNNTSEDNSPLKLEDTKETVNVPTTEELEFELPALKKEYQEEVKEEVKNTANLHDYDLDNLSGEVYHISDK